MLPPCTRFRTGEGENRGEVERGRCSIVGRSMSMDVSGCIAASDGGREDLGIAAPSRGIGKDEVARGIVSCESGIIDGVTFVRFFAFSLSFCLDFFLGCSSSEPELIKTIESLSSSCKLKLYAAVLRVLVFALSAMLAEGMEVLWIESEYASRA